MHRTRAHNRLVTLAAFLASGVPRGPLLRNEVAPAGPARRGVAFTRARVDPRIGAPGFVARDAIDRNQGARAATHASTHDAPLQVPRLATAKNGINSPQPCALIRAAHPFGCLRAVIATARPLARVHHTPPHAGLSTVERRNVAHSVILRCRGSRTGLRSVRRLPPRAVPSYGFLACALAPCPVPCPAPLLPF